jgi:hypothetical protein
MWWRGELFLTLPGIEHRLPCSWSVTITVFQEIKFILRLPANLRAANLTITYLCGDIMIYLKIISQQITTINKLCILDGVEHIMFNIIGRLDEA